MAPSAHGHTPRSPAARSAAVPGSQLSTSTTAAGAGGSNTAGSHPVAVDHQQHSSSSSSSQHLSAALSTARQRLSSVQSHLMSPAPVLSLPSMSPSTSQLPRPLPALASSVFTAERVPQAPEDPLFGLMRAFKADSAPRKVDLGIGAYRDDQARPWILPVVRKADELLNHDPALNHEYLPIAGLAEFDAAAQKLILGADSPAIAERRVSTLQTISGTGAVHLGGLFLSKFYPTAAPPIIFVSDPTWPNHHQIFSNVHMSVATYPYFDPRTKGLDLTGMLATLRNAPQGSVVVLHACAHNPTGVDPTREQWAEIANVIAQKKHFPFFDCAYQGFASGDLARDAWAIRFFVDLGFELCIAQSFAKNFGLYGERAGAFHFVTSPSPPGVSPAAAAESNAHVGSQLGLLQRSEISNPPAYGAKIVSRVLNDPALYAMWEEDLRTMSGRIQQMRVAVRQKLEAHGTPGNWEHITSQIGMFSFTGLGEEQVRRLRDKWHVYMTKNGRISMAGLNSRNVDYFVEAVDSVVRETAR